MNKLRLLFVMIFVGVVLSLNLSCEKVEKKDPDPAVSDVIPVVTTTSATSITETSATVGGNVTAQVSTAVTSRGVCWGESPNPDITGNHSTEGSGTGIFSSNLTGLSPGTTYFVRAYAIHNGETIYANQVVFSTKGSSTSAYPAGYLHCDPSSPTAIVDVANPSTGKIWMDRNLGASQVATSSTDAAAYGDLYQWGRFADGHQCRTSAMTIQLSTNDQPGHWSFIVGMNSPYDWRSDQNHDLWQGTDGVNNPCPTGYRLPTEAELHAERMSWSSNDAAGAFASPLKLPLAGQRRYNDGSVTDVGSNGYYWSSTVTGTGSRSLIFDTALAAWFNRVRATGYSVRCIKE
jgi:hypothetical protein